MQAITGMKIVRGSYEQVGPARMGGERKDLDEQQKMGPVRKGRSLTEEAGGINT
jgi:hypothetical protein